MVSAHTYPTFELSDTALLLAKKLLLESESCRGVWKSPIVRKSLPPYLKLSQRLHSDTQSVFVPSIKLQ